MFNIDDLMKTKNSIKALSQEEKIQLLEELTIVYFGKKSSKSMELLKKGDVEGYRSHYQMMHDEGAKITEKSLQDFLEKSK